MDQLHKRKISENRVTRNSNEVARDNQFSVPIGDSQEVSGKYQRVGLWHTCRTHLSLLILCSHSIRLRQQSSALECSCQSANRLRTGNGSRSSRQPNLFVDQIVAGCQLSSSSWPGWHPICSQLTYVQRVLKLHSKITQHLYQKLSHQFSSRSLTRLLAISVF